MSPRRLSSAILVASLVTAVLPLAGCNGGGNTPGAVRSERATIRGTVLDRATGAPVAEAKVEFPDGRTAVTDAQGRFELGDFALGTTGELHVRAADGRRAGVPIRPLGPGALEVVLHAGL